MNRIADYPSPQSGEWATVDANFESLLAPADEGLRAALAEIVAAGLPAHDVSALQGSMLALFARMTGARRILEIGTLGGYSTIWLARALSSGGTIVTIERNERHAAVAARNIDRAGLTPLVDLRIGPALDILPTLTGPFDLIFIDADKPNNPDYIRWALRLSRPGTIIIGDNVVRGGQVIEEDSEDKNVQGVRAFLDILAKASHVHATAIQTVGEKGWDGFALAVVGSDDLKTVADIEDSAFLRTLHFRREHDGLEYRFEPTEMSCGRAAWRRTDLHLLLQWNERAGWHVADPAGTILSRPWDVEKDQQDLLPPRGHWVSRKGPKSYVYTLEWED